VQSDPHGERSAVIVTQRQADLELPATPASVPAGRHLVRSVLVEWGLDALLETAELLVSELITNGIKHAQSYVHITVRVNGDLTITVTDSRPDLLPVPLDNLRDPEADGGRGLALIATLSDDWGVHRDGASKSVWFCLHPAA
jgi:anti-sigma regulatory factor (Ser/Thr protein kinase)